MGTKLHVCPRCKSEMKIGDIDADIKNPPRVVIYCSNKGCLWNMTCSWDDLSTKLEHGREALIKLMVEQWNEGFSE